MGVPPLGYLGFLRAWPLVPPGTVPLLLVFLFKAVTGPAQIYQGKGRERGWIRNILPLDGRSTS